MAQRQGGTGGLHGGSNFADIYDVAEYQPDILRPLQPKVTSQDALYPIFVVCLFIVVHEKKAFFKQGGGSLLDLIRKVL